MMMCSNAELGTVVDIVVWLRSLGLGKYEAAFRENDIDETVLPSLTHENLKELGVASLGHRVKLLEAITALRQGFEQTRFKYAGLARRNMAIVRINRNPIHLVSAC